MDYIRHGMLIRFVGTHKDYDDIEDIEETNKYTKYTVTCPTDDESE